MEELILLLELRIIGLGASMWICRLASRWIDAIGQSVAACCERAMKSDMTANDLSTRRAATRQTALEPELGNSSQCSACKIDWVLMF